MKRSGNSACGKYRKHCKAIIWSRFFQYAPTPAPVPTYTVTYAPNGGTGSFSDAGIASGSRYTVKTLAATGISRAGYIFNGWNTQADGKGTAYPPGGVMDVTGDITLYPQWREEPRFSVTYDANGGTGGVTDSGIAEGARYSVKTAAAAGVTRQGYIFTGWNTQAGGGGAAYQPGESVDVTEDMILYAQWREEPKFSVTYDANGGTGGVTDSGIAEGARYSVKTAAAAGVTRQGYIFTGWNTQAGGGGAAYQPGESVDVTEDMILYAQWREEPRFSVTYDANGGTGGLTDSGIASGSQYHVKDLAETGISNSGNAFTGWNTQANGSGTEYQPEDDITVTGNLTFYAQWTPIRLFSVTYNANGGTGEYSDNNIEEGSKYTVKTQAETGINKQGSVFLNWNSAAAGTGTVYQPESSVLISGDLTLYAQWNE